MAALTASNGIVTISNTTDTFSPSGGTGSFLPASLVLYGSVVGQLVLKDADGVILLELGIGTIKTSVTLDGHFFAGIRPWKSPIKASTCTAGLRLHLNGC
jgi:hypothetical protein